MRLTVSLFSALSRALDHIPNAFSLAQEIELEKKRVPASPVRLLQRASASFRSETVFEDELEAGGTSFAPLFSTNLVIAMLTTKRSQNWWITLERQEVRNCLFCR